MGQWFKSSSSDHINSRTKAWRYCVHVRILQELQERKKIKKKERKKKKRPDNEADPPAPAAAEHDQAEPGESSDEATNRQNSPEPEQQPQDSTPASKLDQEALESGAGPLVLDEQDLEATSVAAISEEPPNSAVMPHPSQEAVSEVKGVRAEDSGATVTRRSPRESKGTSARALGKGSAQAQDAMPSDAAPTEGLCFSQMMLPSSF